LIFILITRGSKHLPARVITARAGRYDALSSNPKHPVSEEIAWTQENREYHEVQAAYQFKDDEYKVTCATTVEEAKTVLMAGFESLTEKNGIMLFRKPKRFLGLGP
jgi:hypothetical protein